MRTPQGEPDTPYAKMLKKSMGQIDWSMEAEKIERLIRGGKPVAQRLYILKWKNRKDLGGGGGPGKRDRSSRTGCGFQGQPSGGDGKGSSFHQGAPAGGEKADGYSRFLKRHSRWRTVRSWEHKTRGDMHMLGGYGMYGYGYGYRLDPTIFLVLIGVLLPSGPRTGSTPSLRDIPWVGAFPA